MCPVPWNAAIGLGTLSRIVPVPNQVPRGFETPTPSSDPETFFWEEFRDLVEFNLPSALEGCNRPRNVFEKCSRTRASLRDSSRDHGHFQERVPRPDTIQFAQGFGILP